MGGLLEFCGDLKNLGNTVICLSCPGSAQVTVKLKDGPNSVPVLKEYFVCVTRANKCLC